MKTKTESRPITTLPPTPWEYVVSDGIHDAQGRRIASLSYAGKAISQKVTYDEQMAVAHLILDAANTPPSRWAAYAGSAGGSDISLHADRLSALQHVYLLLDVSDGNDDPDEPMDEERLAELIEDHCNAGADDWHIQEIV